MSESSSLLFTTLSTKTCSVEGCLRGGKLYLSVGWCQVHYKRWKRHGDPLVQGRKQQNHGVVSSFLEEALKTETDECIIWPFSLRKGYGQVGSGRSAAHAIACAHRWGPRPQGKEAAHNCGTKACVNKRHLEWKTPVENAADKIRHGTALRGDKNHKATLTETQVLEIRKRRASGERLRSIGESYGVGPSAICDIAKGRTWGWL